MSLSASRTGLGACKTEVELRLRRVVIVWVRLYRSGLFAPIVLPKWSQRVVAAARRQWGLSAALAGLGCILASIPTAYAAGYFLRPRWGRENGVPYGLVGLARGLSVRLCGKARVSCLTLPACPTSLEGGFRQSCKRTQCTPRRLASATQYLGRSNRLRNIEDE